MARSELTLHDEGLALEAVDQAAVHAAGQVANLYARQRVFARYLELKAANTLLAQRGDLASFATYLTTVHAGRVRYTADQLQLDANTWLGITHGLVEGFKEWLVQEGAAVATINRRLSTIKVYVGLATKAEVIHPTERALIKEVAGYHGRGAKEIDGRRPRQRKGYKKAQHTTLTDEQARQLKSQADTPQGRRDMLLMCLLLDHGLRAGEVHLLTVEDVDLHAGQLRFYRPKVDKAQTHKLSADTLRSLHAWINSGDCAPTGPLLRASRKGGKLTSAGITTVGIGKRVQQLGEQIGIGNLSPHDCRHYWATYWAKRADRLPKGLFTLQESGGWRSLAMPRRYVEESAIVNEGMA
jgi:integrase